MSLDPAAKKRIHAVVFGKVQGVNFRAYTARRGRQLGLNGWVRNVSDGTVEVIAEGEHQALTDFLSFLRTGPPSATVSYVDVTWAEGTGEFQDFRVVYS